MYKNLEYVYCVQGTVSCPFGWNRDKEEKNGRG